MKKDDYKRLLTATALLLPTLQANAQEDSEDEEGPQQHATLPDGDEEDFLDEDDVQLFNLRGYTNELISIVVLVVIISVVRHMVAPRHRTGCTFFIIFFAAVYYIIHRYL